MKISLKWLNDYIDIQDDFAKPDALASLLTADGIEVESVHNLAKQFDHVVVGHILQKAQHPNADRLSLCQVSTGEGVVHQIVCGAKNHNEGDRVVVALPGAVLPGEFSIKRSKIRDVESGGMLCSEKELGLKSESEGILILPSDAPVGQSFAKFMGYDDILFELKVTPNRADCLSHFGLAREIGALRGREAKFPVEKMEENGGSTKEQISVELRESEMCPRYAGRGVRGVKVGPSPLWLKQRLESVGINSINNVVDVTNFVMLELGQPLHAFDVREIKGRKIIIDRAVKGESFVTLDGTELKLEGSELTIRDVERPVALAGIVGGKNSGIQDDTVEIFIESAYFTPASVRRTARKFGVETDSSYRFARGTNPEAVLLALDRAALLIQKVAGGNILGEHYDEYPHQIRRLPIYISLQTVEDRLGYKILPDDFKQWMYRLGCTLESVHSDAGHSQGKALENTWQILPPIFRWDILADVDLVEEYARLSGYQNIPETLPALSYMPAPHDPHYVLESKVRRLLQGAGCLQAINYAFVSQAYQDKILGGVERLVVAGIDVANEPVRIVNPLNEELNVMRTSLIPGLIRNVQHNSRFGNPFGRLFEIGFGHSQGVGSDGQRTYLQQSRLAFAFWGAPEDLWLKTDSAPTVFRLKASIESLLCGLAIKKFKWVQPQAKDVPEFLHPGQAICLEFEGKHVGVIGALHPSLLSELKIRESVAVAELNLDKLLSGQPRSPKYQPISKMPAVDRDIAVIMPKDLPAAAVELEIRKTAGDLLRSVRVFDVFEGGSLAAGSRSVAFRMLFQAQDATLEDQKINDLRDKVVAAIKTKFGVSIRQ